MFYMATNRTFTMIKPDAVANGHAGKIIDHIIQAGFNVVALKYTADAGTIRNLYAKSIDANAIHGSDSDENAAIEGNFFFSSFERF